MSISPAGAPDDLFGPHTYYAPRVRLTVAADERSGLVDGDYFKYEWGVGSPFDGRPPPPILGHVGGAWRCAK